MELEDYKEIISLYQQKSFDLFNENIVLKSQINSLTKKIDILIKNNELLSIELEKQELKQKELEQKELEQKELNKNQISKKRVTNSVDVDYQ
jgi:hypothetical protein